MAKKRNRKTIRGEGNENLFDLGTQQPRFRINTLHRIYPNTNFAGKYALWIDFYTIFPYDFDSVEAYITLEGKDIQQYSERTLPMNSVKAICTTPFPNKQYLAASVEGFPDTIGIPFLFDSIDEMLKVKGITGDVIFTYHNTEGIQNKLVIRVISPVSFIEKSGYRDYVIERQCTQIPSLLEDDDIPKRKSIITEYPEVIQAKADLSGKKRDVPLFTNLIRSESNLTDEERYSLTQRIMDDLITKERLEEAQNAFLNLFYYTDTEMISPMDESTQAYILGSS